MRVIGEIPHPDCKITIFEWNNRYLLKLESGYFEQTFKMDIWDLPGETALEQVLSTTFLQKAMDRFKDMEKSLQDALSQL